MLLPLPDGLQQVSAVRLQGLQVVSEHPLLFRFHLSVNVVPSSYLVYLLGGLELALELGVLHFQIVQLRLEVK